MTYHIKPFSMDIIENKKNMGEMKTLHSQSEYKLA